MTSDISDDAKLDRCCPFKMQCTTHIMLGPSHRPLGKPKWNSIRDAVVLWIVRSMKRCSLKIRMSACTPPVSHGPVPMGTSMVSMETMMVSYMPLFLIPHVLLDDPQWVIMLFTCRYFIWPWLLLMYSYVLLKKQTTRWWILKALDGHVDEFGEDHLASWSCGFRYAINTHPLNNGMTIASHLFWQMLWFMTKDFV